MGRRRIQTTVFLGLLIESGNSHLELHERTRCPVKFRAAVILMAECSQPHVQQQNCRHRAFVTSHHPRFCYVLSTSLIYKMSTSILAVFFRTACKSTTASNEGRSRPIVCLVKIDWHYQTSPLSKLSHLYYILYTTTYYLQFYLSSN